MSEPTGLAIFNGFLQWLKDQKPRAYISIGAVGMILVVMPPSFQHFVGIDRIMADKKWIFFLPSLGMLIVGVTGLWSEHDRRKDTKTRLSETKGMLPTLSQDESFLIKYCVQFNIQTVILRANHPAALSLEQKGIFEHVESTIPGQIPFTIPNSIWPMVLDQVQPVPDVTDSLHARFQDFESKNRYNTEHKTKYPDLTDPDDSDSFGGLVF